MENLCTTTSILTALTNASVEDGSRPITDQVARHVDTIHAELEARHNERIKQLMKPLKSVQRPYKSISLGYYLERKFKSETTCPRSMNKKLTERKNQIKEDLAAEHGQALQTLRSEHEQGID